MEDSDLKRVNELIAQADATAEHPEDPLVDMASANEALALGLKACAILAGDGEPPVTLELANVELRIAEVSGHRTNDEPSVSTGEGTRARPRETTA
jgi:hypothetical protein